MKTVCVIIARGGSKGIPNKNIINFCGQPLISWTIYQAKKSSLINDIWVSSDSKKILQIAEKLNVKTIKRPENISSDRSSSEEAWLHALNFIEQKEKIEIDLLLTPQVTSPLREFEDFDRAISKIIHSGADSLFSSNEIEDFFVWEKTEKSFASMNYDFKNRKRRQLIDKTYHENGSFWIFKPKLLRNENNRLGGKIDTYVMEKFKMFQIDNFEDIKFCELLMKGYSLNKII